MTIIVRIDVDDALELKREVSKYGRFDDFHRRLNAMFSNEFQTDIKVIYSNGVDVTTEN